MGSVTAVEESRWKAAALQVREDRDNDDYVLSTEVLTTLGGQQLRRRRKSRNRFVREHRPVHQTLDLGSVKETEEVGRCAEEWFRQVELDGGDPPREELHGLRHLLELAAAGRLDGVLGFGIRVAGELVGFSIVEVHGTDIVSGVAFKAVRALPGAAEFLRSTSAKALAGMGYHRINVQQDLGLSGLRTMKSSYQPVAMLRKWTIAPLEEMLPC